MIFMDTDREWEKWGAREPYFGVITNPEFRRQNLDGSAKERFFASGRAHVDHIMNTCRERIDRSFRPRRALDFGCGVGRVTLALASVSETVIGLDVSESMLREAENNRTERGINNVTFLASNDSLSTIDGSFDFIHSFIVFQHLHVARARAIFAELLGRLVSGGVFAAHFTYAKTQHRDSFGRPPEIDQSRNETQQDGSADPVMLMISHDLNELLFLMQVSGIRSFFTEFTDHGGELGVLLYFQK
jgi:SAM-dependent methyltransferase